MPTAAFEESLWIRREWSAEDEGLDPGERDLDTRTEKTTCPKARLRSHRMLCLS